MAATVTQAEKDARRQARIEKAAAAAEELRTSEGWQRWLSARQSFRTYSLRNQLIIALELPEARFVAGFKRWIALGYCVRKGEHATYIWKPMPPSKKKLAAWEAAGRPSPKPRTGFGLAPVFGDHQVDAIDGAEQLPLSPPVEWGHVCHDGTVDLDRLIFHLTHFAEEILDVRVTSDPPLGASTSARGCYVPSERSLWVSGDLSLADQAKTFIHELAHALIRLEPSEGDPQLDRASEEVVVESTAYAVCAAIGLDASLASVPYLAGWSRESTATDLILGHAQLIHRLAGRIEDALAADEPAQENPDA